MKMRQQSKKPELIPAVAKDSARPVVEAKHDLNPVALLEENVMTGLKRRLNDDQEPGTKAKQKPVTKRGKVQPNATKTKTTYHWKFTLLEFCEIVIAFNENPHLFAPDLMPVLEKEKLTDEECQETETSDSQKEIGPLELIQEGVLENVKEEVIPEPPAPKPKTPRRITNRRTTKAKSRKARKRRAVTTPKPKNDSAVNNKFAKKEIKIEPEDSTPTTTSPQNMETNQRPPEGVPMNEYGVPDASLWESTICDMCDKSCNGQPMIACSICTLIHHRACVNIDGKKKISDLGPFYCPKYCALSRHILRGRTVAQRSVSICPISTSTTRRKRNSRSSRTSTESCFVESIESTPSPASSVGSERKGTSDYFSDNQNVPQQQDANNNPISTRKRKAEELTTIKIEREADWNVADQTLGVASTGGKLQKHAGYGKAQFV